MEFGAVVVWLVVLLALGAAALPLAAWVFPRGDHGAYAFTVALVTVGVVAHLVGHVAYRLPAVVAGVVALVALSALAHSRVAVDRRGVLEATGVFVVAFSLLVAVRALEPSAGTNPHWVGEMFLDFGLLSALERADRLPPGDMWFAGEPVRYHYGGHLLTSLLAGLSGTPPAIAYNLGLATFYAALATMAWGVAGSIARPMAVPTRLAAGLGVFFVAVAGNLETAARVVVWLLPRSLAEAVVDLAGVDPALAAWSPGRFFYWDASRVITRQVTAATEFPLFSWLHGDLHAHVLVKPLVLLVVALGVAYWHTPPRRRRRRLALLFGAWPPLVGLVAVVNVWSLPTVVGLVAVVLVFAPGSPLATLSPAAAARVDRLVARRPPGGARAAVVGEIAAREAGRVAAAGAAAVAVAVLAVAWTAPYWWLVVVGGPGVAVGTWDAGTPPGMFLVVQGAFIVGLGAYLLAGLATARDRPAVALGALAAVATALALVGWAVLGLLLALLALAWWSLHRDARAGGRGGPDGAPPPHPAADREADGGDRPAAGRSVTAAMGPETMLVVAGAGILLVVEVAMLEGDPFNSIFKPYADVWQLWGVALGVALARLAHGWPLAMPGRDTSAFAGVALVLVVVLVVSTGFYGALALPAHVESGNSWSDATEQVRDAHGHTLDATAYVTVLYPDEAAAIAWLDDREGQPTIATGVTGGYHWEPWRGEGAAAPASLTGVATVVGWEHHERQYRGGAVVAERSADVVELYTGEPARQAAILERYDVEYVYVGPAERARWGDITIGDVDGVSVAAAFDEVVIYAVDPAG